MKSNSKLIITFTLLLVIKFALLPLFDMQNEKLSEAQHFISNNEKLEYTLANKEVIEQGLLETEQSLERIEKKLYHYKNDSEAKLKIQGIIESFAKEFDVAVNSISWEQSEPHESINALVLNRVSIHLKGNIIDLIRFQGAINNEEPNLKLVSMVSSKARGKDQFYFSSKLRVDTLYLAVGAK